MSNAPSRIIAVMALAGSAIVIVAGVVAIAGLILIRQANGEQMQFEHSIPTTGKVLGPRHGYNCPDFPDSRCPEVVMVSAKGVWPPDDQPRANFAFLMMMFRSCRIYGYDDVRDMRGVQHWISVQCDLQ